MHFFKQTTKLILLPLIVLSTLINSSLARAPETVDAVLEANELPHVPMNLPAASANGQIYIPFQDQQLLTTINPVIQERLDTYLRDYRDPIAAVVVLEVKTGKILAMSQGRNPKDWDGKTHAALHAGFPAASLFKTVVSAAAFEVANFDSMEPINLHGGCSHVRPTGVFMREKEQGRRHSMSLYRAFGFSCNGFFAKLAVNHVGLSVINDFAKRLGWGAPLPTDFYLEESPFFPPTAANTSAYTVGRYAAGFGNVGISAVHAAWMMATIANNGLPKPIQLFEDSTIDHQFNSSIFSEKTARRLLGVMDSTIKSGTASFAFRRGKYRRIKHLIGGKTGTLTGHSPEGLTTWFAGLAPLDDPEIAVASVVLLEQRWHIKAPHLAAEAFWTYFHEKTRQAESIAKNAEAKTVSQGETVNH